MKFYFTFGCGQRHAGKYFIIEAEDQMAARQAMFDKFGQRWCACYESAEEAGVEMYNYELATYDENHERASGELNDLLRKCTTMNRAEVELVESFSDKTTLSPKVIEVIDEIYKRRM
jgi:hypothetical protein